MATHDRSAEFVNVLSDLEGFDDDKKLHDLVERAHQIELLSQTAGWAVYVDYLAALTANLQRIILSGRCRDIEDYRTKTGVVEGIRMAMDAPQILMNQVARLQADRDFSR